MPWGKKGKGKKEKEKKGDRKCKRGKLRKKRKKRFLKFFPNTITFGIFLQNHVFLFGIFVVYYIFFLELIFFWGIYVFFQGYDPIFFPPGSTSAEKNPSPDPTLFEMEKKFI